MVHWMQVVLGILLNLLRVTMAAMIPAIPVKKDEKKRTAAHPYWEGTSQVPSLVSMVPLMLGEIQSQVGMIVLEKLGD